MRKSFFFICQQCRHTAEHGLHASGWDYTAVAHYLMTTRTHMADRTLLKGISTVQGETLQQTVSGLVKKIAIGLPKYASG